MFKRFEEAATFFCVACEYNERITLNLSNMMKGMDHEFLLASRRKCLKLWNKSVIRRFAHTAAAPLNQLEAAEQTLTQQEMTALIELMISKFLPCFFRLANPNSTAEDKAMIDEIRQDWLGVLDLNLPGNCFLPRQTDHEIKFNNQLIQLKELQVFHDFMAKLFEDQFVNHFHSLNVNKTNLMNRYREAVQILKKIKIN